MAEGREYDWDDKVETPKEGNEFVLLTPGEYPFRVIKFERGVFPGTEKTPSCKKAVITMEIDGGAQGQTLVRDDFILYSTFEWKMCQFFKAIGARKSGEPLVMNWNKVVGTSGRCKIEHESDKKKPDVVYNRVNRYLDPSDAATPAPATSQGGFPWESNEQAAW